MCVETDKAVESHATASAPTITAKGTYGRKQWSKSLRSLSSEDRLEHLNRIVVEECAKKRAEAKEKGTPLHPDYALMYERGFITKDKNGEEVGSFYTPLNPIMATLGICLWIFYGYRAIRSEPTWQAWLLTIIVCAVTEDLIGSIMHIVLDDQDNLDLPYVLSKQVLGFRWHHIIPRDIALEPIEDVLMDMFGPTSIWLLVTMSLPVFYFELESCWMWMFVKSAYALIGQLSHRCAHMYPSECNWLVRTLQKLHVFVAPETHQSHHKGNHDTDFAITNGTTGAIIDFFYDKTTNRHFWLMVFAIAWYDIPMCASLFNPKMTGLNDMFQ